MARDDPHLRRPARRFPEKLNYGYYAVAIIETLFSYAYVVRREDARRLREYARARFPDYKFASPKLKKSLVVDDSGGGDGGGRGNSLVDRVEEKLQLLASSDKNHIYYTDAFRIDMDET